MAIAAVTGLAVLAVRGYRLGVTYEHTRITVRGYLRTRVIDRERITEVTDFPALRWTTHDGRRRWTPLTAFLTNSGEFAATRTDKERSVERLRQWVRRGGGERKRASTAVRNDDG
ncbi:hypothetical protein ACH4S8_33545 [Streptomyces sp. NPDC021080]|uniref:hypothetical protein n=1 Tax=Streptomyces sp. NPDC021080 TaxID=3365110 RepID=UPI0037B149CB